jgi:predicted HNH restriction endonuclease
VTEGSLPRARLSIDTVLKQIRSSAGTASGEAADRLIKLVVSAGAQPWPRRKGVALRMPGRLGSKPEWLTVAVVSTAGTVYNNWCERWAGAGVSDMEISVFERSMKGIFGANFVSHPSAYQSAGQISRAVNHWMDLDATIHRAATQIRHAVERGSRRTSTAYEPGSSALLALEGQLTETRVSRRGRNATLRKKALEAADGQCAACLVNYGNLLGGRGRRVLQVHHRKQLSDRDQPEWTNLEDLDVVCANCHLLVHANREAPIPVEALRAQLLRDRN